MMFPSLRSRLIAIIMTPLLVIGLGVTIWQFLSETKRAEEIFDRGLLSAALSISRDVAISDGDALSPATRRLVNNTSGGEVFYHVFAPDGVFVTGYSTPPVLPKTAPADLSDPFFYDARYQGKEARALRFQYVTTVSDVSGVFNVTVWQNADLRRDFVREIVMRSIAVIALLVISVGLVVWFGVGFGLRPLLHLQSAIAKRTPTELEPIRRKVPVEAQGIVTTLNDLLDRVSRRISSKDEFISNAAHQLRNPVAGLLALAEAVENAPNPDAARKRGTELVLAARQASRLTNQLLSFERAAGSDLSMSSDSIVLNEVIRETVEQFEAQLQDHRVKTELDMPKDAIRISGDQIMVREALINILNNAVVHGDAKMNLVSLRLWREGRHVLLEVKDNGVGIPADKHIQATSRFSQINSGPGSGLGLAIASRVMTQHKGFLKLVDNPDGAVVQLTFPLAED